MLFGVHVNNEAYDHHLCSSQLKHEVGSRPPRGIASPFKPSTLTFAGAFSTIIFDWGVFHGVVTGKFPQTLRPNHLIAILISTTRLLPAPLSPIRDFSRREPSVSNSNIFLLYSMGLLVTPSWLKPENDASKSTPLAWAVTTMACMAMYIDTFQATMVNFGLSAIMESLDMTPFDVNWVLIAYNLAFATILPISGAIVDRYGLRFGFLFGTGFLTWASALCAATPNKYGLIVGRVFCGVGAAMSVSGHVSLKQLEQG